MSLTLGLACGSVTDGAGTPEHTVWDASEEHPSLIDAAGDGGASFGGFTHFDGGRSPDGSVQTCSQDAGDRSCGPSCDALQDEATALVDSNRSCNADTDCVLVNMYELIGPYNCLGAFQCAGVLRASQLEAFRTSALDIIERYASCGECSSDGYCGSVCLQAQCVDTTNAEVTCSLESRRCEALIPR